MCAEGKNKEQSIAKKQDDSTKDNRCENTTHMERRVCSLLLHQGRGHMNVKVKKMSQYMESAMLNTTTYFIKIGCQEKAEEWCNEKCTGEGKKRFFAEDVR
jgi:hypothetical protein